MSIQQKLNNVFIAVTLVRWCLTHSNPVGLLFSCFKITTLTSKNICSSPSKLLNHYLAKKDSTISCKKMHMDKVGNNFARCNTRRLRILWNEKRQYHVDSNSELPAAYYCMSGAVLLFAGNLLRYREICNGHEHKNVITTNTYSRK